MTTLRTNMPLSKCLDCGQELNRASSLFGDYTPSQGDYTICFCCGHLMVFTQELTLRELDDNEMRQIAGDKRLIDLQRARHLTYEMMKK